MPHLAYVADIIEKLWHTKYKAVFTIDRGPENLDSLHHARRPNESQLIHSETFEGSCSDEDGETKTFWKFLICPLLSLIVRFLEASPSYPKCDSSLVLEPGNDLATSSRKKDEYLQHRIHPTVLVDWLAKIGCSQTLHDKISNLSCLQI